MFNLYKKRILEAEIYNSLEEVDRYDLMVKKSKLIYNIFIKKILNNCSGGLVIDIGTGTGKIPIELAKSGKFEKIIALDNCPNMIEKAKENASKERVIDKIDFLICDVKDGITYPDNYFDVIISHNTFHHFKKPENVLKEIKRIIKPEGGVFIRDIKKPIKFLFLFYSLFVINQNKLVRKQFKDSLKASLSYKEWKDLFENVKIKNSVLKRSLIVYVDIQRSCKIKNIIKK